MFLLLALLTSGVNSGELLKPPSDLLPCVKSERFLYDHLNREWRLSDDKEAQGWYYWNGRGGSGFMQWFRGEEMQLRLYQTHLGNKVVWRIAERAKRKKCNFLFKCNFDWTSWRDLYGHCKRSNILDCTRRWTRTVPWAPKFSECGAMEIQANSGQDPHCNKQVQLNFAIQKENQYEQLLFESNECFLGQALLKHVATSGNESDTYFLHWSGLQWVVALGRLTAMNEENGVYEGYDQRLAFCGRENLMECGSGAWREMHWADRQNISLFDTLQGNQTDEEWRPQQRHWRVSQSIRVEPISSPSNDNQSFPSLWIVFLVLFAALLLAFIAVFVVLRCNRQRVDRAQQDEKLATLINA